METLKLLVALFMMVFNGCSDLVSDIMNDDCLPVSTSLELKSEHEIIAFVGLGDKEFPIQLNFNQTQDKICALVYDYTEGYGPSYEKFYLHYTVVNGIVKIALDGEGFGEEAVRFNIASEKPEGGYMFGVVPPTDYEYAFFGHGDEVFIIKEAGKTNNI